MQNDLPSALEPFLEKPQLYDPGDSLIWTDPHITRGLLNTHLDPTTDRASYRPERIEDTLKWVSQTVALQPHSSILDLGCGPGLYTQRWSTLGHGVRGIDFNQRSLDYAMVQASEADLAIDYALGNYLEVDFGGPFDLVTMISCDFGVLAPDQRAFLLRKILRSLNPGGHFAFDVRTRSSWQDTDLDPHYEFLKTGFWRTTPHHVLSQSWIYPEANVDLSQFVVMTEDGDLSIYRFWEHAFDKEEICRELETAGFATAKITQDLTGLALSADSKTIALVAHAASD
jgi:SAM-dependent methyltransferase